MPALVVQDNTSHSLDELLPVAAYGLSVEEADIEGGLGRAVAGAEQRHAELAGAAYCACKALSAPWQGQTRKWHREWPSAELVAEADERGLFASLMAVLGARLRGGAASGRLNGDGAGAETGGNLCALPSAAYEYRILRADEQPTRGDAEALRAMDDAAFVATDAQPAPPRVALRHN